MLESMGAHASAILPPSCGVKRYHAINTQAVEGLAMPGLIDELLDEYRLQLERYRNRPFLKAVMAGCALAACADGEVSFSERIRVDQVLETLERLNVFDPHEGVDLFNDFAQAILASPKTGRDKALQVVRKVTDDRESASVLVRVCLAVAEASGQPSTSQEIEVVMLCSLLGIDHQGLGLYRAGEPAASDS